MKKVTAYLLLSTLLLQVGTSTTVVLASEVGSANEETPTVETNNVQEEVVSENVTTESTVEVVPEEIIPEESVEETQPSVPEESTEGSTEESTTESTTDSTESTEESKPEDVTSDSSTENTTESTTDSSTGSSTTSPSTPNKKPDKKPVKKEPSKTTSKKNPSTSTGAVYPMTAAEMNNTPIRFSVTKTTQEFINEIGESARTIGQENDLYASVMIAQAILESGSGQSSLSNKPNYNLFGIKGAYKGSSVSFYTLEDNGSGNLYGIQASFRKYPSYKESLSDYAELMTKGIDSNSGFYFGATKKQAKTYQEATKFLTGRYATDTRYDEKLNELIKTYDLTYFDSPVKKGKRKIAKDVEVDSYEVMNPENKEKGVFIIPLEPNYVVSSPYGIRGSEHHDGIDLAIAANSPIYASSDGQVVETGFDGSAGNYVIVSHPNGLYTSYFHLNKIGVKPGDKVVAGNVIGLVGSTGNSTGAHLHFGLSTKPWTNYLDPSAYLEFK